MHLRVIVALAVATLCWASAFVGIRAGLEHYPPQHLALLRFLVGCCALGAYGLYKGISLPKLRDLPSIALQGLLGFAVYHTALNIGEKTVSAASASFIIGSLPVYTAVLAYFFLGEKITRRTAAGIGISMIGITLISFGDGESISLNLGALYVLLAAISASFFIIVQKQYLKSHASLDTAIWALVAGMLFMIGFAPGLVETMSVAPLKSTLYVVYLGIFPTAVAYAAWTFALVHTDVIKMVVTQYATPVLTLAIGFLWLGEMPGIVALLGGAVALCGVVVITWPSRKVRKYVK